MIRPVGHIATTFCWPITPFYSFSKTQIFQIQCTFLISWGYFCLQLVQIKRYSEKKWRKSISRGPDGKSIYIFIQPQVILLLVCTMLMIFNYIQYCMTHLSSLFQQDILGLFSIARNIFVSVIHFLWIHEPTVLVSTSLTKDQPSPVFIYSSHCYFEVLFRFICFLQSSSLQQKALSIPLSSFLTSASYLCVFSHLHSFRIKTLYVVLKWWAEPRGFSKL